MPIPGFSVGLTPQFPSPPGVSAIDDVTTEEAAVRAPIGRPVYMTALVKEGDLVAKGAAVACLRHAPDVCFTAPIAGRVARLSHHSGRKLAEVVLFAEPQGGVKRHDFKTSQTLSGLRQLMQGSGMWQWLRRRPFGGMPDHDEVPAAIVVMVADTRPFAPDPQAALQDRAEDFGRGLRALLRLTDGPVLICQHGNAQRNWTEVADSRLRTVACGDRHPQASAGIRIHQLFPAGLDAPVWDIHAEDTAALGALLDTGELPMTRLVHIAGAGLQQARTVRTHPGADLRQLTRRIVAPGPHVLISGSPLDGHPAQWLAPRHRQITVLPRETEPRNRPHWLIAALTQSAVARPAIPSAALTQSLGGAVPAIPFIRALGAGDDETAMKLGVLSLLEEDLALADYVLSETGLLTAQLRAMLDRIQTEFAA